MTYVSHRLGESRLFDCIYDPSFILSGENDIQQSYNKALDISNPIQLLSKYDLMFSSLPKQFRQIYYKQNINLPNYRLRAGKDETVQQRKYTSLDIHGTNRPNFFFYTPVTKDLYHLKEPDRKDVQQFDGKNFKNYNKGCQTIFRESSAQTHPYQPEPIVDHLDLENSNILLAATVLEGFEQPGVVETEIIERAMKRRYWEKTMIHLKSEHSIIQYKAVLEAFEWEEWMAREEMIEKYQNLRMKIVENLIEKRCNYYQNSSNYKIISCTKRITEYRKKKFEQLQANYNRDLRKLDYKHNNIIRKYKKESISVEYGDPSSDLYGPQMRFGVNPKRKHFIGFKDKYENRFYNLSKEIDSPVRLKCPFTKLNFLATPKQRTKEYTYGFCGDKYLEKLYQSLKFMRYNVTLQKVAPKCFIEKPALIEKKIDAMDLLDQDEINKDTKNIFKEPKEKHVTKPIVGINSFQAKALKNQKKMERILKNEKEVKKILEDFEGATIGWLLEFFEKEIERLNEKKRIHAMCLLAEEERFKREALEAGKRQKESKRLAEHQDIYNNVTKMTRETIALYLEDVFIEETEQKSESAARNKVQSMAKYIDKYAEANLKVNKRSSIRKVREDDATVINGIVNDFIFTEVQKTIARRNTKIREKKNLLAAQATITSLLENQFPPPPLCSTNSGVMLTDCVFKNLLEKVIQSSSDECEEMNSLEHPATLVTNSMINKIIKKTITKTKWKSSAEVIVDGVISGILKKTLPTETTNYNRLNEILAELQKRLGDLSKLKH